MTIFLSLIMLLISTINAADRLSPSQMNTMLTLAHSGMKAKRMFLEPPTESSPARSYTDSSATPETPGPSPITPTSVERDTAKVIQNLFINVCGSCGEEEISFAQRAVSEGVACLSRLSHGRFMNALNSSRLALRKTGKQADGSTVFQMVRIVQAYAGRHFNDPALPLDDNGIIHGVEICAVNNDNDREHISVYELFVPASQRNIKDSNL